MSVVAFICMMYAYYNFEKLIAFSRSEDLYEWLVV
jgi:hypothetical protein